MVKQNCNRKSDLTNQICPSDWRIYFKGLFTSANENQSENVLRNIVQNHDNGDLERPITDHFKLIDIHANRSPGPDGICIEMLKVTRHEILPYLITLFNNIFNSGTFPTDWCKSILCPIYQNGCKASTETTEGYH